MQMFSWLLVPMFCNKPVAFSSFLENIFYATFNLTNQMKGNKIQVSLHGFMWMKVIVFSGLDCNRDSRKCKMCVDKKKL